jgi:hypothetical protein
MTFYQTAQRHFHEDSSSRHNYCLENSRYRGIAFLTWSFLIVSEAYVLCKECGGKCTCSPRGVPILQAWVAISFHPLNNKVEQPPAGVEAAADTYPCLGPHHCVVDRLPAQSPLISLVPLWLGWGCGQISFRVVTFCRQSCVAAQRKWSFPLFNRFPDVCSFSCLTYRRPFPLG